MAVRQMRIEPAIIHRIQSHRKQRKLPPPSRESLAVVRQVVRDSTSIEGAIAAVKAIETAWDRLPSATRDAIGLLVVILELSDTTDEALVSFSMMNSDGALLKPLEDIRTFVNETFPDARLRIVPGDEVASTYLDIFIPTDDYPSFRDAYVRLRDWVIERMPGLSRVVQPVPRPAKATHV